jgi:septum formation protein
MLHLASQSPRRRQLLEQLGVEFVVLDVDVPERCLPGETPPDYVSRVALEKARAGLATLGNAPGQRVLGADTEVVLDEVVFGKPRDEDDAVNMLRRLSGRTHAVISTVWIVSSEREQCETSVSQVRFDRLDDSVIAAYVATGEPFGKAGAYAIQGRGAALIAHLDGSYTGVMGLPVFETARLLRRFAEADTPFAP